MLWCQRTCTELCTSHTSTQRTDLIKITSTPQGLFGMFLKLPCRHQQRCCRKDSWCSRHAHCAQTKQKSDHVWMRWTESSASVRTQLRITATLSRGSSITSWCGYWLVLACSAADACSTHRTFRALSAPCTSCFESTFPNIRFECKPQYYHSSWCKDSLEMSCSSLRDSDRWYNPFYYNKTNRQNMCSSDWAS